MTTITLNEKTKAGKTLLELAKMLAGTSNGIIVDKVNKETAYNPDFVAKIEKSKQEIKEGKVTRIKKEDLHTLLGL